MNWKKQVVRIVTRIGTTAVAATLSTLVVTKIGLGGLDTAQLPPSSPQQGPAPSYGLPSPQPKPSPPPATSTEPPPSETKVIDHKSGTPDPLMPQPAGVNQIVIANGDIDSTGTCHVRVFRTGEAVSGLGGGTYQLWLATGPPTYLQETIDRTVAGAAADPNNPTHTCPLI